MFSLQNFFHLLIKNFHAIIGSLLAGCNGLAHHLFYIQFIIIKTYSGFHMNNNFCACICCIHISVFSNHFRRPFINLFLILCLTKTNQMSYIISCRRKNCLIRIFQTFRQRMKLFIYNFISHILGNNCIAHHCKDYKKSFCIGIFFFQIF